MFVKVIDHNIRVRFLGTQCSCKFWQPFISEMLVSCGMY